jgi:hypothetical protein
MSLSSTGERDFFIIKVVMNSSIIVIPNPPEVDEESPCVLDQECREIPRFARNDGF